MRTPVYWHRLIYRNTYGRSHPAFERRFELIAGLVEPGSSVIDLCCGDARLYTHHLRRKGCSYTGVDISLSMAPHQAQSYLIKADVRRFDFPVADYVVMMEALYHFYPKTDAILERMRKAARKKVIVLEQIANKVTRLPKWMLSLLSNPGDGSGSYRFDREQLELIFNEVDPDAERKVVCNGYDLLTIMEGLAGK